MSGLQWDCIRGLRGCRLWGAGQGAGGPYGLDGLQHQQYLHLGSGVMVVRTREAAAQASLAAGTGMAPMSRVLHVPVSSRASRPLPGRLGCGNPSP